MHGPGKNTELKRMYVNTAMAIPLIRIYGINKVTNTVVRYCLGHWYGYIYGIGLAIIRYWLGHYTVLHAAYIRDI